MPKVGKPLRPERYEKIAAILGEPMRFDGSQSTIKRVSYSDEDKSRGEKATYLMWNCFAIDYGCILKLMASLDALVPHEGSTSASEISELSSRTMRDLSDLIQGAFCVGVHDGSSNVLITSPCEKHRTVF